MTREKLLRYGKEYLCDLENACCKIDELHLNFVRESIKALQQESCEDCISRQAAIDALKGCYCGGEDSCGEPWIYEDHAIKAVEQLPSAQPERRCVNCGRTVNNGGWYEDGRARCPIEEHYALPKDGYCHLWEKRKDWEDDYVKRAEEGEK